MLPTRGRYALKALVNLSHTTGTPKQVYRIAQEEGLPLHFLETIMRDLRDAGFIRSKRGKGGGYELARSAEQINFAYVLQALNIRLAPLPCLDDPPRRCEGCAAVASCSIRGAVGPVFDEFLRHLGEITLASSQNERVPAC